MPEDIPTALPEAISADAKEMADLLGPFVSGERVSGKDDIRRRLSSLMVRIRGSEPFEFTVTLYFMLAIRRCLERVGKESLSGMGLSLPGGKPGEIGGAVETGETDEFVLSQMVLAESAYPPTESRKMRMRLALLTPAYWDAFSYLLENAEGAREAAATLMFAWDAFLTRAAPDIDPCALSRRTKERFGDDVIDLSLSCLSETQPIYGERIAGKLGENPWSKDWIRFLKPKRSAAKGFLWALILWAIGWMVAYAAVRGLMFLLY